MNVPNEKKRCKYKAADKKEYLCDKNSPEPCCVLNGFKPKKFGEIVEKKMEKNEKCYRYRGDHRSTSYPATIVFIVLPPVSINGA